MDPHTLTTLKLRQSLIEATIGKTTSTLAGLSDAQKSALASRIADAEKKLEELKIEYKENEEKILELELVGLQPVRTVGRPKKETEIEFNLPGTKTNNRELYIASLETSIQASLRQLEEAEKKLEEFRNKLLAKIENNKLLIRQTKARMGIGFDLDDL